jgi:hypothetical protein
MITGAIIALHKNSVNNGEVRKKKKLGENPLALRPLFSIYTHTKLLVLYTYNVIDI